MRRQEWSNGQEASAFREKMTYNGLRNNGLRDNGLGSGHDAKGVGEARSIFRNHSI